MKLPLLMIVSESEAWSSRLMAKLKSLRNEAQGGIRLLAKAPEQVRNVEPDTAAVIFQVHAWRSELNEIVTRMRADGFTGPILVDSEAGHVSPEEQLNTNIKFVSKHGDGEILGTVRRTLKSLDAQLRNDVRQPVSLEAQLYFAENRRSGFCMVLNLSRGGACLKFSQAVPVEKGETVKLRFQSEIGKAEVLISGRIAWINEFRSEAGIEFTEDQ